MSTGAEPLPAMSPDLSGLIYTDIIPLKFTYALTSDVDDFMSWSEKASDAGTYFVNDIDIVNSHKFSPFIISHECNTANEGDGCCMIEPGFGGICLIRE